MTEALEDLTIVALDARGDGVAEDGAVVPLRAAGRAGPALRAGRRAELVEVLSPSSERVEPFCQWFGRCGGCAAQHMGDDLYRAWKRSPRGRTRYDERASKPRSARLSTRMARGAGARPSTPAFRMARPDEVGFMRARSHEIIAIDACPLFAPGMEGAVEAARALAGDLRGLMKPLDIWVTATLDGLDVDLRGSGPLEATETRKLIRTAEALDLARVSNHGAVVIERRAPRVASGDGARLAAARRLPASDGGRRRQARGIRRSLARQGKEGRGPLLRRGRLRSPARPNARSLRRRLRRRAPSRLLSAAPPNARACGASRRRRATFSAGL